MRTLSETELECRMGRLLQAGVSVAALTMLAGGALYLAHQGDTKAAYGKLRPPDPELSTFGGILHGAFASHPAAIIQLAVIIMIATPVLRVAFAVFGFAVQKDRLYTGISLLVLALVTYGLLAAA